jgi:hypothetical protein
VLKPKASPLGKLMVVLAVCLFWNGMVGLFTYFEIALFMNGDPGRWSMAAFLLIFQIIGVALIVGVIYQLLVLANPRPTIILSRESVPLGGSLTFEWQLTGAAHRVRSLQLTFEGREEAQYRRGTSTQTDTNVFHRAMLREVGDAAGIARGTTTIQVPRDTMHTFAAENNKIIWSINMKGHINRWPDLDESFDIIVTPR